MKLVDHRHSLTPYGLYLGRVVGFHTAVYQSQHCQGEQGSHSKGNQQSGIELPGLVFVFRGPIHRDPDNLDAINRPVDCGYYFFFGAGTFCSDLGSDQFFGEAFCRAETISWPAAGVETL